MRCGWQIKFRESRRSQLISLPPANEVWGKVIFLHLFVILFTGGGHAWLLPGGGVCGCSQGVCVVAPGGCAWLLLEGSMHGCSQGVCMVAPGGHAWLLCGVCGCSWGGMCGCTGGGVVAPRDVHGIR